MANWLAVAGRAAPYQLFAGRIVNDALVNDGRVEGVGDGFVELTLGQPGEVGPRYLGFRSVGLSSPPETRAGQVSIPE